MQILSQFPTVGPAEAKAQEPNDEHVVQATVSNCAYDRK